MNLSNAASTLLDIVADLGGPVTVEAETIPGAAELIAAGYAKAEDAYEGPLLSLTDAGKRAQQK